MFFRFDFKQTCTSVGGGRSGETEEKEESWQLAYADEGGWHEEEGMEQTTSLQKLFSYGSRSFHLCH